MDPKQSLAEIQTYIANLEAERDKIQEWLDQFLAVAPQIAAQLRPLLALLDAVAPEPAPAPTPVAVPEPQPVVTMTKFGRRYTEADAREWAAYIDQGHTPYEAALKYDCNLKTIKRWLGEIHRLCENCGAVMSAEEAAQCTPATGYCCRACRPVSKQPDNNGHIVELDLDAVIRNGGAY